MKIGIIRLWSLWWLLSLLPSGKGNDDEKDGCHDKEVECQYWARMGACDGNAAFMLPTCPQSCNVCGMSQDEIQQLIEIRRAQIASVNGSIPESNPHKEGTDECADHHEEEQCAEWAETGHCNSDAAFMLYHCPKSCNVCGKSRQEIKELVNDRSNAVVARLKNDNNGVEEEEVDQCFDQYDDCPDLAEEGECEGDPGFMLHECAASCDACGLKDEQISVLVLAAAEQEEQKALKEARKEADLMEQYGVEQRLESRLASMNDILDWMDGTEEYMQEEIEDDDDDDDDMDWKIHECQNRHAMCTAWAVAGYCEDDESLRLHCAPACRACDEVFLMEHFGVEQRAETRLASKDDILDWMEETLRYMREPVVLWGKERSYRSIHECRNRHAMCTAWAVAGYCDDDAPLRLHCGPACRACHEFLWMGSTSSSP